MRRAFYLLAVLMYMGLLQTAQAEEGLVTQMDTDEVDITTQFTGKNILIFGAMNQPGQVVIKVQSPKQSMALSRDVAVGPFWLKSGKLTIDGTPGLFYLMSSQPIEKLLNTKTREQLGLSFQATLADTVEPNDVQGMSDWREAFLRLKRSEHFYQDSSSAVKLVSNRLFFATITLPANTPLGDYHLDIYLVSHGKVVSHQSRSLNVQQVHLEHWVARVAHGKPWVFGLSFTLLAMTLGLGLGMVLRRDNDA